MKLYLEPLMTALPKLSCHHRAYFDSGNLIIELGTELMRKGKTRFTKEIYSGTPGIKPEIKFVILEEKVDAEITDDVFTELNKYAKVKYKLDESGAFKNSDEYKNVINYEQSILYKLLGEHDSSIITKRFKSFLTKSGKGFYAYSAAFYVNSLEYDIDTVLHSYGVKVPGSDIELVRQKILECLVWKNNNHVTPWENDPNNLKLTDNKTYIFER